MKLLHLGDYHIVIKNKETAEKDTLIKLIIQKFTP